ncbi:MAG: ABC-2 transporter permease [Firmicutes bacterium]|nr:ABC-2 transporter permease [Bacillota bacterium]
MKALVMKDLHVLRATLKYYLFLVVVFTLGLRDMGSIFIILYAAMLPYTALAYDERAHFELQAAAMPYSWRDLVLSKYLLGWLVMLVVLPVSIAIALLCQQLGWGAFYIEQQLSAVFAGMMLMAVCLPIMFRKGVEVGRILNILLIVVTSAAAMTIFAVLAGFVQNAVLLWLIVAAVAVAASWGSVKLSEKWYKKRIME